MTDKSTVAVLFDWDLTLARVLGDVSESERLQSLFGSQGLNFSLGEIEAAAAVHQNGAAPDKPRPQTRQDIINSYFRILAYLGHPTRDWALGNRLYDAHSFLPTFLYDDALPLLRVLADRGLALGIISNHASSARAMIEKSLAEFIRPEHIVISQEVGVHKPAKTIFQRALQRMRLKNQADRCLFVGNSLPVDAIGAVQQGGFGRALWLDREQVGAHLTLPDGVCRITTLDEVLNFI